MKNAIPSQRLLNSALALIFVSAAGILSAQQVLYTENFDDLNAGARWTVNAGPSDHTADFAFDYSTVGIAAAPNSGGNTIGLKLQANVFSSTFGGVSVSPTGQSFVGDYVLTFDMWLNYNGPVNGGGAGSTQVTGAGLMTAGTTPQWAGGVQDSVWFGAAGDGGTTADYRAYSPTAATGYLPASGVFAAGTDTAPDARNNTHPYYAGFGGEAAPAAQLSLYPGQTGTTITGAPGFKWRAVEIKKQGNSITYKIDDLLIATVNTTGMTLGGNNILLNHFDINSGSSGDPNASALLFGLIDNVKVEQFSTVVSVIASTPPANEQGPVNGVFTVTRSGDASLALTVNYTVGGTATSGSDYTALPGSVTFAVGAASTNITVVPIDDGEAEFTETVILTLGSSPNYGLGASVATVSILDNEVAELTISATRSNLLESFSGGRAVFQLDRKGLLASVLAANLTYAGNAVRGTDFNGPLTVALPANVASTNFNLTPLNDLIHEGPETVIVTVTAGEGYVVGSPASATATIIDDDLPATTVLFMDKFDTDTSANWGVNAADGGMDTFAQFGYNYGADSIPEAPSSSGTFTATRGLKFRVNESLALENGLSVSPLSKTFTGDYRLRFDMWLNFTGPLAAGGTGSTEHLSAGVGTSGMEAVWPSSPGQGVWFTAASDGQVGESEGIRADYGVFMASSLQHPSAGWYAAGTNLTSRGNLDPYYSVWGGMTAPAGQLGANPSQTGTTAIGSMGMAWHTVTITKQGTNVTWDIDGRRIVTVDITGQTLGDNVFIGYHDWYISVATNTAVQFGLVDNVRVEDLIPVIPPTVNITLVQIVGGNVEVFFTSTVTTDAPSAFVLQEASAVTGTYGNVSATITGSGGSYKAVRALGASPKFYRIRRL